MTLSTIKKITDLDSSDEKEIIERDLMICKLAGESYYYRSNLSLSIGKLKGLLSDDERRRILDQKDFDVRQTDVKIRYGFCRGSSDDYRSIKKLQQYILDLNEHMQPIREIVEKIIKTER